MTREDIIRMYEKANGWSPAAFANTVEELERFAALIAAAEREACAALIEGMGRYHEADAIRAKGNNA